MENENLEEAITDEEYNGGGFEKEEEKIEESFPIYNVSEIVESVKLPGEEDALKKLKEIEPDVKEKKEKAITQNTVDEVDKLYKEFNSFLEDKVDLVADLENKTLIPTGIDILDAILGGGFASGAFNVIAGSPGSGKTMLAAQTLGNAQRIYGNKGLISSVLDAETATTMTRLANLGVTNPKIRPYTNITVEKVFKLLESLCLFKIEKKLINSPAVVIWDSIANTLSQKEMDADDVNSVIGYKQKLLSLLIPQYVAKCGKFNICLLAINQLRDNISMSQYAPAPDLKLLSHNKTLPGGNIIRFNAFQLLEMKVKSMIEPDKIGFDGYIAKIKVVKNKLFVPNVEVEIVGDFVRGFNNFFTNYNFLKDKGRLKTGAWNYLINLPEKKFRTKDAQILYNSDEEFHGAFDEAVKETIYKELIEKHNVI